MGNGCDINKIKKDFEDIVSSDDEEKIDELFLAMKLVIDKAQNYLNSIVEVNKWQL